VRTTGFSFAYSLAAALFGGFTPAISTYLIQTTGNRAVPGLWLVFAAVCGLVAALVARPQSEAVESPQPVARVAV
jgi:MHS family citrate/tricarballylate:H+ symporter-like MFS transporter